MIQVRRDDLAEPNGAVRSHPLKYAAALRLIEAACRLGSFSKAARDLGVSHTAITAAVDRVEKALGQTLFTRSPAGMAPTAAALDLAQAFRTAERLVGRAWARGRTEESPPSLGVATLAEVGVGWLSQRLDRRPDSLPGIDLQSFGSGGTPDFSTCDLALILASKLPPHLVGEQVWPELLVPVCTPGLAEQISVSSNAPFEQVNLIVHDREAWRAWLTAAGLDPLPWRRRDVMTDDGGASLTLALAGLGVALVAAANAEAWIETGQLVSPFSTELVTGRSLYVAWLRDAPPNGDVHRFADWLRLEAVCDRLPGVETIPRRNASCGVAAASTCPVAITRAGP